MRLKVMMILITLTGSLGKEDDDMKSKAHTFYDQRQTGKYNLNVNIKDVQVFSVEDSLASIGDYGSYDYGGDYELIGGGDEDYNMSHLTVNPIFAFLGSKPTKPTTTTSSTTTEKVSDEFSTNSTPSFEDKNETTVAGQKEQSSMIVEITTTATAGKLDAATTSTTKNKTSILKVNDTIEYDEIPVEVLYYRANQQQQQQKQQKKPFVNVNNRRKFKRRHPSVQVIDGVKNNVRVVESDHPTVKICGQGEFRDNLGRCRLRAQRNSNHGLGKIFNLLKAFIPKDDLE